MWFDAVQSYRERHAEPLLLDLIEMCQARSDLRINGEVTIEWPSLWQLDPVEAAQAKLTTAQADQIYLQSLVYEPEDVAAARMQEDGWRLDVPKTSPEPETRDEQIPGDTAARARAVTDVLRDVSAGVLSRRAAGTLLRALFGFDDATVAGLLPLEDVLPPAPAPTPPEETDGAATPPSTGE